MNDTPRKPSSHPHDPMLEALPKHLLDWVDQRPIERVECVVADFSGIAKGKTMPWEKFARKENVYLPSSVFYQTITGDYVDIPEETQQWAENDMLLRPDYSTATPAPWAHDAAIQVIHDIVNFDGTPHDLAPRNVLKRVLGLYEEKGWEPIIAPEIEFYLTKPAMGQDFSVEPMIDRMGHPAMRRSAYSVSAIREHGKVIDDIYAYADACHFEIDTIIQEAGPGQLEINFKHGGALKLADQIFMFKRLLREAAARNKVSVTFMAKPMQNEPGSAMHIHQSVINKKTGLNLFNGLNGEKTEQFMHFIGGLQRYVPSAIVLMAPYENSFKRFAAADSAPINLEWGMDNRTTGLRVPLSEPASRRVENRVIGMDANPYLAFAASLASGYLGLVNEIIPRQQIQSVAYNKKRDIPRFLLDAVELFSKNAELRSIFGPHFCNVYIHIKKHEAEAFMKYISPWETEHLLLNV